jgi:hypothetical protein
VEAGDLEAPVDQRPGRLGGEAEAVVVGVEHEPDLARAVLPAHPPHHLVADELAGVAQADGGRDLVVLVEELRVAQLALQQLQRLVLVAGLRVEEPVHVGPRDDREQGVEVVRAVGPQDEALGMDRERRCVHARIVPGRRPGSRRTRLIGASDDGMMRPDG